MTNLSLGNIRNVVLLGHSGAGKTSICEAMMYDAGIINRLGKVDDGTTVSDYEPDEYKHKISINLALLPLNWTNHKINMIDVPGYFDFDGEVKAGIKVAEGAIITVNAVGGVEVGTEIAWTYCQDAKLPRLLVINKMDRENVDYFKDIAAIQSKLSTHAMPVFLPMGSHKDFKGIIDLVNMKAYVGQPAKETPIPDDFLSEAKLWRERLVEAIAELDDKLIEKFLGGEEIALEELNRSLVQAVASGELTPVLCCAALSNMAVDKLLDAVINFLPSPEKREVALADGGHILTESAGPLAAFVFKTTADPYVGKLTYFKVIRGTLHSNSQVWNTTKSSVERIGQLYMLRGKTQEAVPEITAGDLGAVAKMAITATNDTLSAHEATVKISPISFPPPIYSVAVHPKSKADIDKLGNAINKLVEEDPTIHHHRDPDTAETILTGLGDTQLEVVAEKMLRKFGVGVELKSPRVPYKETITIQAKAEYKHKKQSGGHGQYGHVMLEVEPLPTGTGVEFVDKVVGGSVPRNYIPAVEKGIHEAVMEGGPLGFPVVDVRCALYDGSYHAVDSSEVCFKIAGAGAFKKGLSEAKPILIEPVMKFKITIPVDFIGDVIGDLNTRRAHVQGIIPEGGNNIVEATAPLAEMQRYAINLKSLTQGRGRFEMKYDHSQQVPPQITQKLVAERQAEMAAAHEPSSH